MPLPPFLQRKKNNMADQAPPRSTAAPSSADDSSPVQAARARARRRLLGAVVLLAVGIVGFPLIFETQPRQMPLDVRIETPGSRSTAIAAADAAANAQQRPSSLPAERPAIGAPPSATRRTQPTPAELPPEPAAADAAAAAVAPLSLAPAAAASRAASNLPASSSSQPTTAADNGARAKALLDGADAASQPKASRFIVQVGAYSDGNALRDARQKVEKLGLKTYTQVVDGDGGQRTRVRVGPFTTRDEADRAGARLRSAGLPVAVLVL